MVKRPGHSLSELVVALVLMTTGLGASAATTSMALRWGEEAIREQEAVTLTSLVLDSLALETCPDAGVRASGPYVTEWTVLERSGAARSIEAVTRDSAGDRVLARQRMLVTSARALAW